MGNQYRDHREIVTTERAARVSLDLIADAIRAASPGVQNGTIQDAVSCGTTQAIVVTNNASGLTIDGIEVMDGTDVLDVVYASGGTYSSLYSDYAAGNDLEVFDGEWLEGDYAVLTNLNPINSEGAIVRVSGPPSGSSPITLPISPCGTLTGGYVKGNLVIRARLARFFVGQPDLPSLFMDLDGGGSDFAPEPIAPGVEDMQIAVGVDLDQNSIVDGLAGEWFYDDPADTTVPNIGSSTQPWRALRISLSARAVQPSSDQATFSRPALEDHAAGSADAYRRRVLQTVIDIRNLGGSP
jgi:hypothetical protein